MTDTVIQDRRNHQTCQRDADVIGLMSDRDAMSKTMDGVSLKLDLILAQITKVAVLEEKHSSSTADINRAHLYIANIKEEVNELSVEVRNFIAYSKGVAKTAWAIWGFMGATVLAILVKVLFFLGAHGVTGL